ncbi:hypothetical protein ACOSP7_021338 [Xanthoceras sorbifolium]
MLCLDFLLCSVFTVCAPSKLLFSLINYYVQSTNSLLLIILLFSNFTCVLLLSLDFLLCSVGLLLIILFDNLLSFFIILFLCSKHKKEKMAETVISVATEQAARPLVDSVITQLGYI